MSTKCKAITNETAYFITMTAIGWIDVLLV